MISCLVQALAKDGCIDRDQKCLVTGRYKLVSFQRIYKNWGERKFLMKGKTPKTQQLKRSFLFLTNDGMKPRTFSLPNPLQASVAVLHNAKLKSIWILSRAFLENHLFERSCRVSRETHRDV